MAARPSDSKALSSSNWDILNLPGLNADHQQQLVQIGINTTCQLLQRTQTPAQRQNLAVQLRVHPQHVAKWSALSDLARVPSVGCQYCGLVLHAGVSSTRLLAQTSLPRLHRQVLKLQVATMQRQDLCPSLDQVSLWIQQARWIANQDTKTSPLCPPDRA
ncbi:MAG: DUF4332 domain-containing protein [Elainellaceae cyanobacterium]